MRALRSAWPILIVFLAFLAGTRVARAAEERDPLAHARLLYNQRQFEAAIAAADQARAVPAHADGADLVAARAYLERFRESAASDDLSKARDRLRRLNPIRFTPAERLEFVIGLGETLYYDGAFAASADVFGSVIARAAALPADARERALDWWASALDREARPRSDLDRQGAYQRIRERMRQELGEHPESATASYWLAAAALGQGDWQAAWAAAQAGWVRAPLASDQGESLRADLDRLIQRAIATERARATAQPSEEILGEWERFKAQWSR